MKRISIALFAIGTLFLSAIAFAPSARAAGPCFCVRADNTAECVGESDGTKCSNLPASDPANYSQYTQGCQLINPASGKSAADTCEAHRVDANTQAAANVKSAAKNQGGGFLLDFDPCIKADKVEGNCRDVSIFIALLFRISDWVFGIIGALALLMFIYGGFMFILSQGNSERVQQGKTIIVSAIIGLIVAFGGYVLVKFLATTIGVSSDYILK